MTTMFSFQSSANVELNFIGVVEGASSVSDQCMVNIYKREHLSSLNIESEHMMIDNFSFHDSPRYNMVAKFTTLIRWFGLMVVAALSTSTL